MLAYAFHIQQYKRQLNPIGGFDPRFLLIWELLRRERFLRDATDLLGLALKLI